MSRFTLSLLKSSCGFFLLFLLSACFSQKQKLELRGYTVPIPTKDEVAVVNNDRLSISAILAIQAVLKTQSIQMAYWAGVAVLVLRNEMQQQGKELPMSSALEIARYALRELDSKQAAASLNDYFTAIRSDPPTAEEVYHHIENLVSKARIYKNAGILSHL